ncbi:transcription factor BIM2 isoform X2 [Hevea brasiliensis]|uniref:transcription factor BIM2 isoform X2 n=1 Tax=Hevea brasiliensis TaxID=3981 RepID=UPI0025FC712B|nr:transcription factor BIM2 isoform X2 [Hevea brasiliensis]
MRGKGNQNQDEEEYEEEEFGSRKEGACSNVINNNSSNNNSKDGKNIDKANAIRSKHSVTEQRRRSKINERFQILRDLIPHSDQKKDTASFLLEVIEYVQYLQEKVQKYEGSYQGWSSEPAKLMPWRNSHWRVPSFIGHPQAIKNGSGPGPTFPGKFDENNIAINPTLLVGTQSQVESEPSRDVACKAVELQPELANKLAEFPITNETMNQQKELTIEGGTISISSIYSQGLLNNLTRALQSAGVDLSQANVSVQIDLGRSSNKGLTSRTSVAKNPPAVTNLRDVGSEGDSDRAQKRLKT